MLLLLLSTVHTRVASTSEGAQATIGAGVIEGRSAGAIRRALEVRPSAVSAAAVPFVAVVLEEVVAAEVIVGIIISSTPAAVRRALSWRLTLTLTLRVPLAGIISPSLVEATVALVSRGRQAKRSKCRILSLVRCHRTSCTGPTGTGSTHTRRRRSTTRGSIILTHRALAQTLGLEFLRLVAGLFDALLLRIQPTGTTLAPAEGTIGAVGKVSLARRQTIAATWTGEIAYRWSLTLRETIAVGESAEAAHGAATWGEITVIVVRAHRGGLAKAIVVVGPVVEVVTLQVKKKKKKKKGPYKQPNT